MGCCNRDVPYHVEFMGQQHILTHQRLGKFLSGFVAQMKEGETYPLRFVNAKGKEIGSHLVRIVRRQGKIYIYMDGLAVYP